MRILRFRFTLWRMMIAVAIVAVISGLVVTELRRLDFLRRAEGHRLRANAYAMIEAYELSQSHYELQKPDDDHLTLKIRSHSRSSENRSYHLSLQVWYEHAARYPWLPIEPDPPVPK